MSDVRTGSLPRWDFVEYARPARQVARELLGQRLVREVDGMRVSGIIVETEAYCDAEQPDLACHGDRVNDGKPTARTRVMFGPAGVAYVYFTYGMHWMFNVVTGEEGKANAVLIRSLQPEEGLAIMTRNRGGRPLSEISNGPAKLAQALAIDNTLNGAKLFAKDSVVWIERIPRVDEGSVCIGPRVGLGKTPEPWFSKPWRYWLCDNKYVSTPK